MSHDFTLTVELGRDFGLILYVKVHDHGRAPMTAGPPDRWDPGDPPEWELVAAQLEYVTDNTATLPAAMVNEIAAEMDDMINDRVHDWIEEQR